MAWPTNKTLLCSPSSSRVARHVRSGRPCGCLYNGRVFRDLCVFNMLLLLLVVVVVVVVVVDVVVLFFVLLWFVSRLKDMHL